MRNALQAVAFIIILAVALLADRLMGILGPLGFILTAGPALAAAGMLAWLSDRRK